MHILTHFHRQTQMCYIIYRMHLYILYTQALTQKVTVNIQAGTIKQYFCRKYT